jgi:hypothetical protein
MSGNDQPPTTPEPTGSEPDEPTPVESTPDEPTPAEPAPVDPPEAELPQDEPTEGERDYVIAPPGAGESDAAPKNSKGLIIGVAIAVAVLVIGGIVAAIVLAGGDDDDDKKEDAETSVADFCDVIQEMDSSEGTADDPTIVSDALRDAGTPKDMSDDEQDGRDLLVEIGDDAEDGPAAEKAVQELDEDDTAKVQAFITYIGKVCSEQPDPSDAPS